MIMMCTIHADIIAEDDSVAAAAAATSHLLPNNLAHRASLKLAQKGSVPDWDVQYYYGVPQ